ncbi:MAG: homocysteine S-methyltransferase family protein [Syntrophothermus sp.]
MAKSILEKLSAGKILLSDGAMGTELQKKGLRTGNCPEELNFTQPELIQQVHKSYYDAGSDIVQTNSFGANKIRLALFQMEDRAADFARRSAELAREVCPKGKFVAGSIGPTGEGLIPQGPLTIKEAYTAFCRQAEALAEGGADILFIETMMSIEEAETAVKAARKKTNLPVAASMTFEVGNGAIRTIWGADVKTSVRRLEDAGADIIGSNCGRGFGEMLQVMREMRSLTELPLMAQSNAGIPEWKDGVGIYRETPDMIIRDAEKMLETGVNIIGGCCGTGPEHIQAIGKLVEKINSKK